MKHVGIALFVILNSSWSMADESAISLERQVWRTIDAPVLHYHDELKTLRKLDGASWESVARVLKRGRTFREIKGHKMVEPKRSELEKALKVHDFVRTSWRRARYRRGTVQRMDLGQHPEHWYSLDLEGEFAPTTKFPVLIQLGPERPQPKFLLDRLQRRSAWAIVRPNWYITSAMESAGTPFSMTGGRAFQSWIVSVLADLPRRIPVDRNRVFITGYSRGGNATWYEASHWPDLWAGAAPLAGYYPPSESVKRNLDHVHVLVGSGSDRHHKAANLWSRRVGTILTQTAEVTKYEAKKNAALFEWTKVLWGWIDGPRRNPLPNVVRYACNDPIHTEAYWIEILEADDSRGMRTVAITRPGGAASETFQVRKVMSVVRASRTASNLIVLKLKGIKRIRLWLSPKHHDLTKPIKIAVMGGRTTTLTATPTIDTMLRHYRVHRDNERLFPAFADVSR